MKRRAGRAEVVWGQHIHVYRNTDMLTNLKPLTHRTALTGQVAASGESLVPPRRCCRHCEAGAGGIPVRRECLLGAHKQALGGGLRRRGTATQAGVAQALHKGGRHLVWPADQRR